MKDKYILESMIESALQKDPKEEIAVKANTLYQQRFSLRNSA